MEWYCLTVSCWGEMSSPFSKDYLTNGHLFTLVAVVKYEPTEIDIWKIIQTMVKNMKYEPSTIDRYLHIETNINCRLF